MELNQNKMNTNAKSVSGDPGSIAKEGGSGSKTAYPLSLELVFSHVSRSLVNWATASVTATGAEGDGITGLPVPAVTGTPAPAPVPGVGFSKKHLLVPCSAKIPNDTHPFQFDSSVPDLISTSPPPASPAPVTTPASASVPNPVVRKGVVPVTVPPLEETTSSKPANNKNNNNNKKTAKK